ncbi:hypothetical protein HNQ96_000752 [Aminobacter lissarensis]|uniref:Uncharacterized protein n=1 Tax=Aminobacter carboxidus TaxID=376165 RepID=A0A8E2BCM2_9HYPH|nr:hypothetical protein [Aminobacter lissarensis]MBB6464905.1 hypothetical protein [Aminobacter lissarensis]
MSTLAVFFLLAEMLVVSAAEKPPATASAQQALEQLLPSSAFRLGMPLDELEEVISSRFSNWERAERKRALNNRKDIKLSPEARSTYVQSVVIVGNDKAADRAFKYDFKLTSPLSGARVYSIVFGIKTTTKLISREDWASALQARWGDEHGWFRSDTRLRATYFFDPEWVPIEDRGDKCIALHPFIFRLDEQNVDQVAAASKLLETTGCWFKRDNTLLIKDGAAVQSTFFTVDLKRLVDDVLKRVSFGVR